MSLPTAKFSELSIGKMPTTRAQSSRLSQSGHETADYDDSSDEADTTERPEAPSNLLYDQRDLSPGTKERLDAAFEGRFVVESCGERSVSSGQGKYYAFQLAETVAYSVRIGAPGSNYSNVECSNCNEPQPCRHVFWLLDQINKHTLTTAQKRGSLTLSARGYPSEVPEPFERISKIGIEELAELANWEVRSEPYNEPDQETKAEEIREILAVLSPRTADEYRPDIFDHLTVDQSFTPALARRDLASLVAKSLMVNPDMFHHFRAIVSPNYCAADFFRKMREKADEVLAQMNKYIETGVTEDGNEVYDIPWCARTLTNIVQAIRAKVLKSPLGKPAKAEAGSALVRILSEVVARNGDAYEGRVWEKTPQRKMPDKDRNLFYRLIVSPTRSADPPLS